jgi:toxin ParE1/3/4
MSAHRLRIELSPSARSDLRNILNYSGQQWGGSQRERYRKRLNDGLNDIAAFPLIGRMRPEFGEGARSQKVDAYIVVYKPRGDRIVISRILHQRQDIEGIMDATAE